MKNLKTISLSMIIAIIAISVAGLALNVTSILVGWKPVLITEEAYALSVSTNKPTAQLQSGQTVMLTSPATGQTQRINVSAIVPNGENSYQLETTLNDAGDITTFTTGATTWVETVIIPLVGIILYPFTTFLKALTTFALIVTLLVWYRWYFYGPVPKQEPEFVDNIGLLQNLFDTAPALSKKEARKLVK